MRYGKGIKIVGNSATGMWHALISGGDDQLALSIYSRIFNPLPSLGRSNPDRLRGTRLVAHDERGRNRIPVRLVESAEGDDGWHIECDHWEWLSDAELDALGIDPEPDVWFWLAVEREDS